MIVASLTFMAISKAQSFLVSHRMRSNAIEGFFLYPYEFTLQSKYCQTPINVDTYNFFPSLFNCCNKLVDNLKIHFLLYMWSLGVYITTHSLLLKLM